MAGPKIPKPMYLPTPAQIRKACKEIQSGWSADEEYNHRAVKNPEAVVIGAEREPVWDGVVQLKGKLREKVGAGKVWTGGDSWP